LSGDEKQDAKLRNDYDEQLRRHMVYHLTKAHVLPAKGKIDKESCLSVKDSIKYLEELITTTESNFIANVEDTIDTRYTKVGIGHIVSLELLLNTAIHQVRNELSALERMCPQGYCVYLRPTICLCGRDGSDNLKSTSHPGVETHFSGKQVREYESVCLDLMTIRIRPPYP
jgi:hypothetical protein